MSDFRKGLIITIGLAAITSAGFTQEQSGNAIISNNFTINSQFAESLPPVRHVNRHDRITNAEPDTIFSYIFSNRYLLISKDTSIFDQLRNQRFNRFTQITIDRYWKQANPYIYKNVAFKPHYQKLYKPVSAETYFGKGFGLNHPFSFSDSIEALSPYQIFAQTTANICMQAPSVIVTHWDLLPDAPEIKINQNTFSTNDIRQMFIMDNKLAIKKQEKLKAVNIDKNLWSTKRNASLFMNQSAITYWDKGGQNSISMLAVYTHESNYETKNFLWENDLEYKLGFQKQEAEDLVKNEDNFRASTKIGYKAYENWYISGNIDLQTQIFDTYDINKSKTQPVASFFTPAKVLSSLGMDFKHKQLLSVFVSPMTYKLTFAALDKNIDLTKMGITQGRSYQELGGYIKTQLKWAFNDQGVLSSKLYLFSNYINKPENVDFDWETIIDYKITYLLSARFAWNMKYDDDVKLIVGTNDKNKPIYGKRLQFKELFSLGFSYRF